MLSHTADYALRAVLALAHNGRSMRAEEIAAATGAPRNYLAKTLNALVKAGLLSSTRGPLGGFTLAATPDAITVARIVDLFVEPRRSPTCLLGAVPCNAATPCAAHQRWSALTAARRAPFVATTVADLLGEAA